MKEIGSKTVKDAKSILKEKNKINTGKLYNSINYVIENNKLVFKMLDYGQWVDKGRKPGKYVPVDALNKWLKQKGIDLKYSFVINRAIKRRGIKPTFFFTKAVEENINIDDKTLDKIAEGLIEKYFVKYIK